MILNEMLRIMVERDGADLYLSPGCPPMLRAHNRVTPISDFPLEPTDTEDYAFSLMDAEQRDEFYRTKEMNLAFNVPALGRFRTNIFRQRGSVGLVIRLVKFEIPSFEELNLPPVLSQLIMRPRGLILVTGATGSGKSTTLASMIDYRNRQQEGHIITLEDPIEYVHSHKKSVVNQREVGLDTESYDIGMRNVLRQSPDVILVGEIRDTTTMEAVMAYAETGHLVLSTLHSINANQTLERIMQFFPKNMESRVYAQLSLVLIAVISQRLLPTIDGEKLIPAVEIMLTSARLRELISKGDVAALKEVMENSTQDGMMTFDQHLLQLYKKNLITKEEALRASDSPGDLNLRMQGLTPGTVRLT
jgi:twitching motility protein PilU